MPDGGGGVGRAQVFERSTVEPRLRYQGSDFHVMPSRAWPTAPGERVNMANGRDYMHHALIERMNDMPLQREVVLGGGGAGAVVHSHHSSTVMDSQRPGHQTKVSAHQSAGRGIPMESPCLASS